MPKFNNPTTIETIAKKFANTLAEWLGDDFAALVEEYEANKEGFGAYCCPSHNYCDPNQAILDAFESVTESAPDIQNVEHIHVMNTAWVMAGDHSFYHYDIKIN